MARRFNPVWCGEWDAMRHIARAHYEAKGSWRRQLKLVRKVYAREPWLDERERLYGRRHVIEYAGLTIVGDVTDAQLEEMWVAVGIPWCREYEAAARAQIEMVLESLAERLREGEYTDPRYRQRKRRERRERGRIAPVITLSPRPATRR